MFLIYERRGKKQSIGIQEMECSLPEGAKSFWIDSPLEMELVARQLAWHAVFQEVEFTALEAPGSLSFKKAFEASHLAANLLLSDAADYGVAALKNGYACRKRAIHSALSLKGAFQNIPAVIAGAGPSLTSLKPFENKALLFAGGAAIDRIDLKPHFAASIDKEGPLKKIPDRKTPFCFQSRLNHEVLSQVKGPLLRAPESHFDFLRWLEGEEEGFDGGWTVGNFLVSLAISWGCNPIILVGMDFCYKEGKKYAQDEEVSLQQGLVQSLNRKGEVVFTQRDWQMAAHWMGECAKRNPDRTFIDGSGEGLDLGPSIGLGKIDLPLREDLSSQVEESLQAIPRLKRSEKRWKQWKEELTFGGDLIEEKLLFPLWQIWKPVFEREVSRESDLEIHRTLFYERVRKEHLDALH